MTAKSVAFISGLAMSLCSAAQGQGSPRFALTAEQVAQALSSQGARVVAGQVSLLANVVALEPQPRLDVVSVGRFGDRMTVDKAEPAFLVKLACREVGICLPFYVVVKGSGVPAETGASGATGKLPKDSFKQSSDIFMRVGTRAILQMDDKRSHVQINVISLENGKAGDKIRVTSPDHKQSYTAEVVGPALLKWSY